MNQLWALLICSPFFIVIAYFVYKLYKQQPDHQGFWPKKRQCGMPYQYEEDVYCHLRRGHLGIDHKAFAPGLNMEVSWYRWHEPYVPPELSYFVTTMYDEKVILEKFETEHQGTVDAILLGLTGMNAKEREEFFAKVEAFGYHSWIHTDVSGQHHQVVLVELGESTLPHIR